MPPLRVQQMRNGLDRGLLPVIGLAGLAVAAFAYCQDRQAYFAVLTFLIADPYRTPFIDAQQVPAVIDCWRKGINVYLTAPCDPMQRPWAYSPFWLSATFIPAWRNWMGLALDAAFLTSLSLLPRPRRRLGSAAMILATVSSIPVFALERGNMDLVMFVLIACGGWFWCRNFCCRLAGYAFFAFAGFLKFYPLVLFSLFIRERVRVFTALSALATALIVSFAAAYHGLLREAAANLPIFWYFSDAFGATQMPGGLLIALQHAAARNGVQNGFLVSGRFQAGFIFGVWLIFIAVCVCLGLGLARRPRFRAAIAALAPDERGFLVIGAALICGCFFAGTNDSYRGVHFLFILPGMIALAAMPGGRVFGFSVAGILLLMWGLALQRIMTKLSGGYGDPISGSVAIHAYWLIHELTWWYVVSVLLGVLFCFVTQSPVWLAIRHATRREVPTPA
jgi:hypothetical protein